MKKDSSYQRRKKVVITIYVDDRVKTAYKELAEATRIPQSVLMREALDDLLEKYKRPLNKYRRERAKQ